MAEFEAGLYDPVKVDDMLMLMTKLNQILTIQK